MLINNLLTTNNLEQKNKIGIVVVELRKMQVVGRASFSVTLPPDWVKENKLNPSDQINITREDDGSLRLMPGTMPEEKEVKITIDADKCKYPGLLMRLIIGGYNRGCDSIEIVSEHAISENHWKEIHEATDSLMGMGIVESTSNRVMLQSVVDASKFPLKPLLKRFCEIITSMCEDALQAFKDNDHSLATDIINRENEVNKIYWLMGRQTVAAAYDKNVLKKIELNGTPDLALHVVIFPRMKSVADYAVDIADNLLALGKSEISDANLQKIIRLGRMAHELYSDSCKSFFNGDVILANNAVESFKQFDKMKDELLMDLGSRIKDVRSAMHLMTIIRDLRGVAYHGSFIAEVTVQNSTAEKINLP
jgi:phosphate uptake regulator